MRLHGNSINAHHIDLAARESGAWVETCTRHGSRSRDHAYDVYLTGSSRYRAQRGGDQAATWDQWGIFLGVLFDLDPTLTAPRVYTDRDDFDWQTGDRFTDDGGHAPCDLHGDHRWGDATIFEYGTPKIVEVGCRKCTAVKRWKISR